MGKKEKRVLSPIISGLVILLFASLIGLLVSTQSGENDEALPPVSTVVLTSPPPAAPVPAANEGSRKQPVSNPPDASTMPRVDPRSKMSGDLLDLLDGGDAPELIRVIVQAPKTDNRIQSIQAIRQYAQGNGLHTAMTLDFIGATVLELRADELLALSQRDDVWRVSLDAKVQASQLEFPTQVTGAEQVWDRSWMGHGYTGKNVTVAVIDSGVDVEHPDFQNSRGTRVREQTFLKFGGDGFGHGTHVAGIIAGNGKTFTAVGGEGNPTVGIAPKSNILSLRVLNDEGVGYTSTLIAAIAYATVYKEKFGVRVINLSLGHPVFESYLEDPLAMACAVAAARDIAVVCSAGNAGSSDGETVYGSITSPGHAPWVITVGATNTNGTVNRANDTIASFSSRGPTPIDGLMKPDLVAPGVHIVNCQPTGPDYLTDNYPVAYGLGDGTGEHYMTLNGTSMSAPVVAGTLALMFEANPSLTANLAKAMLLYTAEKMTDPGALDQGNGSLNVEGAVRMALAVQQSYGDVGMGDFQLAAKDEDDAKGMLDPYSTIDGDKIYWGVSFIYGSSLLWSHGTILDSNVIWGNGKIWSDTILWTFGEPWFDPIFGNKTPAFADTILWTFGDMSMILWAETILWTFGALPGVDPSDFVVSDTILWTFTDIFNDWSPSMAEPSSLATDNEAILVEGEDHYQTGTTFLDSSSPYYPQEPVPAEGQ